MAYNFKSESEVKEFLHNLGIEYRFGCYSEKNPEVCHLLGDYLETIKKDYEKARKLYKSNCDDYKYGRSCMKFGTYALVGKAGMKEDFKTAYEYYEKGCEYNVTDSCFNQGMLLLTGHEKCNTKPDAKKAMSLLERACEGGSSNACYYASGYYIRGLKNGKNNNDKDTKDKNIEYSVPKNMERAYKYALRGCELGNGYCCVNLSQMYAKGDGVAKNDELAAKYKQLALEMQEEIQSNKTLTFQEGLS